MSCEHCLRWVTSAEATIEVLPWGQHEWFSSKQLTGAKQIQLVRVSMPPGKSHAFHTHPCMEEVLYFLSGRAEQWVAKERRIMQAGEVAFVPMGEVHGTYNVFDEPVVFLAILSPTEYDGPPLVDVSRDEPWRSLREQSAPPGALRDSGH